MFKLKIAIIGAKNVGKTNFLESVASNTIQGDLVNE